jgi:hypothetical protein
MNELKNLASIMLGKMVIMETLLQKQPKTTEPNLSQVSKVPKKNKASVPKPKNVAKSPKMVYHPNLLQDTTLTILSC